MKNAVYECLGHDFTYEVPTTEQEYITMAKRPNAAVEDGVDHTAYHSTLGKQREEFVKAIEKKTGNLRTETPVAGKFKEVEGKKVQVTKKETHGDYYKRVCAEMNLDPDSSPFADLVPSCTVAFDPSVTVRTAGQKKLPNDYYVELAKQAVTEGHVAQLGKTYIKELGKPWPVDEGKTGDELVTAVGWAIREIKLARDKKAGLKSFLKAA